MSAPFFTVMIPTRNRAGMLRTAFKSLQWQTFGDFEAVAMDDGSTDDTPRVFEEFAGDRRFAFKRFPPQGVPKCRNYALGVARGRFVDFLDDDDIWLPERLARYQAAAESRPEVGFWYSNAYVWRYGRVIGHFFDPRRDIPDGRLPPEYAIGERHLPYVTTNMSIAKAAVDQVGPFHESIPILADTEMVVRVLAAGWPAAVIREPLSVRRLHDAQVTRDHAKAFDELQVVLASARLPPAREAGLRHALALETAEYLVKGLEPAKARAFLRERGGPRDAGWLRLYAAACLPRPALAALRAARAARLKAGARAPATRAEFARVEALVRPIL